MANRRIALSLWSFDNEYQELQRQHCREQASRHHISLTELSAGGDSELQVQQLRNLLALPAGDRPYAIIVHPVGDSRLISVAREAATLGVGWVVLNRDTEYLHDLRNRHAALPLFCVKPDQHQVGCIQGRQFKLLLPQGGELFYIQGPLLVSTAEARFAGVQQELQGAPIKLVTFRSDWTAEGGEQAARDWLQTVDQRDLGRCLIGAQNDNMAIGARTALVREAERQGRPEIARIRVTGCDGLPGFGQRLVLDQRLAATVTIPPTAGRAVEELAAALAGSRLPPEQIVLGVWSYPGLEQLASLPTPL